MMTFQQLQDQHKKATFKKAVLKHLVDYLDENFRSQAGQESKKKLLDEQNMPVPEDIFEEISVELSHREESLETEIENIMMSSMAKPQP